MASASDLIKEYLPTAMTGIILILMFGLGATVDWKLLKYHIRRPWPVMCGFLSQYIWMPLSAYAIVQLFHPTFEANRANAYAVGILIVGCMPGGSTSNLFCYYANGDVGLSIMMTVFSTMAGFFMVPLVLSVYTKQYTDDSMKVDEKSIAQSMMLLIVPASIGILIRNWGYIRGWERADGADAEMLPKENVREGRHHCIADALEKIADKLGSAYILVVMIAGAIPYYKIFTMDGTAWLATIVLSPMGLLSGFLMAQLGFKLFGVEVPASMKALHSQPEVAEQERKTQITKTIMLETGIQNGVLALAIVQLTWLQEGQEQIRDAVTIPVLMYSLVVVLESIVTVLIMNKCRACTTRRNITAPISPNARSVEISLG